ncbi:PhzF family phenazine biosynthesis protein [Sphingorhabdus lutea]|nr:PhzF family phenazine biosynthesis protein [Sphingorhabdus lutea]
MKLPYFHVDAFTDKAFSGNQAAVIPLENWLDDAILQSIAAENNFAETAFIIADKSGEADFELRWFTPTDEVRMCGHATLASGHVVLSQDDSMDIVTFRTRKVGILAVERTENGYELTLPAVITSPVERPDIAAAIGGNPLEIWGNENDYFILHYNDADEILALAPDFKTLATLGKDIFICTARGKDTDIISRVFVPGAGIDEDPVTGSAHATLAPFWAKILGKNQFTAYQASKRGGHIGCTLENDRVILMGNCVNVVEGVFTL